MCNAETMNKTLYCTCTVLCTVQSQIIAQEVKRNNDQVIIKFKTQGSIMSKTQN